MGAFFSVSNWDDHNELLTEIQKGKVSCKKSSSDAKDISGADLSGAKDLSGADLSGADLSRANLSGADLSGASNKNKANNTKNVKVTDKPTLSNGDCFYSAIYRASKERREVFDRINKDLGLESPEEDAFITAFREKVAKEVEADKLPSSPETNTDVYNTLSTTSSTEPDNYDKYIQNDEISSLASNSLIGAEGECLWENHEILKHAGFPVFPGERDRFGWLTGYIQTKKGILVFG